MGRLLPRRESPMLTRFALFLAFFLAINAVLHVLQYW